MNEKEVYKEFVRVIDEYIQLLTDEKYEIGFVNDISLLPADKKTLKLYLIVALMSCKTSNEMAFYMWAYEELAAFQPNVGKKSSFLPPATLEILDKKYDDLDKSKSKETKDYISQEITNILKEYVSIYMQYSEIVNKERKKLRDELAKLDI